MPAIKITLSRLIELFGKSVNSDLPEPVRALAARMMTLTAHVTRIEQKNDANVKALSSQISALTDIVQALAQQEAPAATAASADGEVAPAPSPTTEAPTEEASEGEESEAAFFARAQQEAEAEVAAINAAAPVAEVTQLPRSKKAGGAK